MTIRRVVVALGTASTSALVAAVEIARALETELLGLFVEDVELCHLAALPFAGEVGFPSAARRALDAESLARGWRAQAHGLRADLASRLAGAPLKWTFEVVRGRVAAALAATAGDRDLVVVPVPRFPATPGDARAQTLRAYSALRTPLLLVGESGGHPAAISVLAASAGPPEAVIDVVATLAPHYGGAVLFVLCGSGAGAAAAWREAAEAPLAARGLHGTFRVLASAEPDALGRLLGSAGRRLVVMVTSQPAHADPLVAALALPVLLLPGAAAPLLMPPPARDAPTRSSGARARRRART